MENQGRGLVELADVTIVTYRIISVARMMQPATPVAGETPYLHIVLEHTAQPLLVPFETAEARDEAYQTIVDKMRVL